MQNLSVVLLLSLALIAGPAAGGDLIKKSKSGICHSPASSYYSRTKHYQAFDSVQACLASGGRLPKNMVGSQSAIHTSKKESGSKYSGYERSKFGAGWGDADGDCQNSRAEALIAQSTTKVRFADERRCRVVTGRWISPYSGKVIQNASSTDIDHVVPLKWAWDHGASNWPRAKREKFANDPINLLSVELSLNREKGAKGPDEWLPPSGKCQYVSRFVRIVKVYELQPSKEQINQYKRQLADYCG